MLTVYNILKENLDFPKVPMVVSVIWDMLSVFDPVTYHVLHLCLYCNLKIGRFFMTIGYCVQVRNQSLASGSFARIRCSTKANN